MFSIFPQAIEIIKSIRYMDPVATDQIAFIFLHFNDYALYRKKLPKKDFFQW